MWDKLHHINKFNVKLEGELRQRTVKMILEMWRLIIVFCGLDHFTIAGYEQKCPGDFLLSWGRVSKDAEKGLFLLFLSRIRPNWLNLKELSPGFYNQAAENRNWIFLEYNHISTLSIFIKRGNTLCTWRHTRASTLRHAGTWSHITTHTHTYTKATHSEVSVFGKAEHTLYC